MTPFHSDWIEMLIARSVHTPGGCWEWTLSRTRDGYGRTSIGGHYAAHRCAYEAQYGPIPSGLVVMHICDNPPCINPSHLKLGSDVDNKRDAKSKGRLTWKKRRAGVVIGERHGRAKLTQAEAMEVKYGGGSLKELSEKFSVTKTTIRGIRSGRIWAHI